MMEVDSTGYAELTVQGDIRYLDLLHRLVAAVAAPVRMPEKQLRELELAVEEAFTNCIEHAYEPGHVGLVSLTAELDRVKLVLSFRDRGMPFDHSSEPSYRVPDAREPGREDTHGLGLHLIRNVMDEVQWVSLGTQGKELRMTRYLHRDRMDSLVEGTGERPGKEDAPLAPPQTYTIRRFRPEDALGVTQCVFQAYGYSYPSPHLYYPQRIVEMDNMGMLIPVVAVSDLTGGVVGFTSAQRHLLGTTAEAGQSVVLHSHRGRSLMSRMATLLDQEVLRAGIRRMVGHTVTSHGASQVSVHRAGYRDCGLVLGSIPDTLTFTKMTGAVAQRESCLVVMKFLVPPEPASVCAPSRHREMIERIYRALERPVTFQSMPAPEGRGEIAVEANRAWGVGDIHVRRIGTDTQADIGRCMSDLCKIGDSQVVYLELPLDQGGIDHICRSAEGYGFFFLGLGPSSVNEGMESLYLQFLNTELDLSYLQVSTPMGKEIFEYVARERERVRGLTQSGR